MKGHAMGQQPIHVKKNHILKMLNEEKLDGLTKDGLSISHGWSKMAMEREALQRIVEPAKTHKEL